MSVGRIIACDADVATGAAWLAAADTGMAQALSVTGPLPLRLKPGGFASLLNAIVSQQVSVASAAAIWGRVEAAGLITPDAVLSAGEEGLRAVGFSRPKIRYGLALAGAGLDYDALRGLPDDEVIATLTAVPGIGIWTAQIYAMFSLGRADVFAPGDLALQECARVLYALDARPKPAAFAQMAEKWSPWRSVAARVLFSYYRHIKNREGLS